MIARHLMLAGVWTAAAAFGRTVAAAGDLAIVLALCLCGRSQLVAAEPPPAVADGAQEKPATGEAGLTTGADLPALMLRYKPPYHHVRLPLDPAITFERVDVIIQGGAESGFTRDQPPYLSIGRDGGYFYKINEAVRPQDNNRPAASFIERLPPARMTRLQELLEATNWLTAAGGEGAALHTDADDMTIAVTRNGKTVTLLLQGDRPAPYAALQKFFYDLTWQEELYYRLTRLPAEQSSAIYQLHNEIESALGRPGRAPLRHDLVFERYHELFAWMLSRWYCEQPKNLCATIDLMVLLKRVEHGPTVAKLRFDRDPSLRATVARALPALLGEKAIPPLAEVIEASEDARIQLIRLGEPAVPTIVSIIEPDVERENPRSVALIRAYIDHWQELPQPIDPRVVQAVIANMQLEKVRDRISYHRQFLKLAGVAEPKSPTALETANLFFKHLQAGDENGLDALDSRSNVGSTKTSLALRESFEPSAELKLETLFVKSDGFPAGLAVSKPLKNKAGDEIHVVVFLSLYRGTDWRTGPALAEPIGRNRYQDDFLKANPGAQETHP